MKAELYIGKPLPEGWRRLHIYKYSPQHHRGGYDEREEMLCPGHVEHLKSLLKPEDWLRAENRRWADSQRRKRVDDS